MSLDHSPPIKITCSVMLERDGKLLLVQEGDAESYGKWNQPAGHLDPGETVFECALRETKEESGYDAELIALQAVYFFAIGGEHIVNVCFRAQPVGEPDAFVPGEILATRWFSREELAHLPQDQLRHRLTERRIRDWLRGVSNPLETIAHL